MSKGFTLIEVLISITILGVILVIILGALRIGVRAWEAGERDTENNQRLQIVLSLVNQQLSSACWTEIKREDRDPYYFSGREDFIEFISDASIIPGNEFGKVYVAYRIESNGEDGKSLQVAEQSLARVKPDERLYEPTDDDFKELIAGAHDISFGFISQPETGESQAEDSFLADKENGLPKAVRFTLRMTEKSPAVSIVARIVSEQDSLQNRKN